MHDRVGHQAIGLFSLLTLLLFGGVGVGLPMLDALRFHGRGEHLKGHAHYEPVGGCRDHAENCLLVFSSTGERAAPPLPPVTRLVEPNAERLLVTVRTEVSHPVVRASTTRAPPSLLV